MPPLIRVQEVSRTFTSGAKTVYALESVSCEIQTGSFVSIVGPSGCGKSTLLKIISGLIPASSGKVLINGASVSAPLENVGMVFQSPTLLKWRSVLANILLPVEFAKLNPASHTEKARALINWLAWKDSKKCCRTNSRGECSNGFHFVARWLPIRNCC